MKKKLKSQGEIFGIALLFVIIVIGIIVYSQIKALDPNTQQDSQKEEEYKILAQTTLNTVLKSSTQCYVERGKDTVQDIINYCLEFPGTDPLISCDGTTSQGACSLAIGVLNYSLYNLFNDSSREDATIGAIPFIMTITVPSFSQTVLNNQTITNFGDFAYKNNEINKSSFRKYQFKRAPSGLKTWSTSRRNIEIELYLYYR